MPTSASTTAPSPTVAPTCAATVCARNGSTIDAPPRPLPLDPAPSPPHPRLRARQPPTTRVARRRRRPPCRPPGTTPPSPPRRLQTPRLSRLSTSPGERSARLRRTPSAVPGEILRANSSSGGVLIDFGRAPLRRRAVLCGHSSRIQRSDLRRPRRRLVPSPRGWTHNPSRMIC